MGKILPEKNQIIWYLAFIVNLILLGYAVLALKTKIELAWQTPNLLTAQPVAIAVSSAPAAAVTPASAPQPAASAPAVAEPGKTWVRFRYRDAYPRKVELVGDFNHWSAQLMTKDRTHQWQLDVQLAPGHYAYNFIVDGLWIRDPSNRKTKRAGQKILSSLQVVRR